MHKTTHKMERTKNRIFSKVYNRINNVNSAPKLAEINETQNLNKQIIYWKPRTCVSTDQKNRKKQRTDNKQAQRNGEGKQKINQINIYENKQKRW